MCTGNRISYLDEYTFNTDECPSDQLIDQVVALREEIKKVKEDKSERIEADFYFIVAKILSQFYTEDFLSNNTLYDDEWSIVETLVELLSIVLERDYHLSYPSIFEFDKTLYLIHGTTHNSKSYVELFKCEDFPLKWKYEHKLINNIPLVDTTMFFYNKKWWIFACKAESNGTSQSSELMLFYSDNPLSENWNHHRLQQCHLYW